MKSNKIKGIKTFTSKGKVYHYHRATSTRLTAEYGTAGFLLEVAELDKKVQRATEKTLAGVITAYKASPAWSDLAPATRHSYERAFAVLRPIEDRPLRWFTPPFIASFRDIVLETRKRWMSNYVLTTLVILLDLAREKGWVKENAAKGVRRVKKPRRAKDAMRPNRPWTPAECRAVLDAAPPYLAVPIGLAMFAGFRKSDVLALEWSAIANNRIDHRTAKRSVDVAFPVHPSLANILAAAPKHGHRIICCNSYGEPWTESGFNSTFCRFIDKLEAAGTVGKGLTMHGLRHTVSTRLREIGVDKDTRKKLMGHLSDAMDDLYSGDAELSPEVIEMVGKVRTLG